MSHGIRREGTAPSRNATRPVARLFFALWPDKASREALSVWADELHGECGGRRMRAEQLHLTLVFLGDVLIDRIRLITEGAHRIAARPFALRVSSTGYWPKKHLAFALPDEVPAELIALVKELISVARQAGVNVQERAYRPHVTLLRNAKCGKPLRRSEAFVWRAESFVLVCSTLSSSDSRYEAIERWPMIARCEQWPAG